MKEKKEEIENKKIIDNEEDTIKDEIDSNDDEIDESVDEELDESDDEELEEDEDDEMYKTRKIDFSNKNEVYQDFFDEKKKSKLAIVIIVIFVLLLIGVICYFVYVNRDKIFNKIDDVVDNMDGLVDVENGDKDNSSGVVASTSSDDSSNVVYIYQKDSDAVAFTYNCKNKKCNVIVTNTGLILYDDKVWYRDMSSYELEQINNTEKTPAKSELNFDGFEEVKSMFDESPGSIDLSVLYEISDVNYIVYKNELLTFDDYNEKFSGDRCKGSYKINDIVVLNCYAYNYKKNTEINFLDDLSFTMLDYGYESGFYYFHINTSIGDNIYVFDELGKNLTTVNSFYINDDKMYYEDGTNKVNVIDNKWKKIDYNNDGINAIYIYNDKLIYLNNEKILNVKNLVNNKDIQKIDVKMNDAYVLDVKDGINIVDRDYSILEKDDINEYIENENITEEEISKIKQCIDNSDKCDEKIDTFHVGYLVKLDKDAKFVSRDYYIDIVYK